MKKLNLKSICFSSESILSSSEKKKISGGVSLTFPTCDKGYKVCDCGTQIGMFCIAEYEECPKAPRGEYMCIDYSNH